jgi:hypothetical protein
VDETSMVDVILVDKLRTKGGGIPPLTSGCGTRTRYP